MSDVGRRRAWTAAVGLALVAAAGLAAFWGFRRARTTAVAEAGDGRLCARCHDAPAAGLHGEVGCDACHGLDAESASALLWASRGLGGGATSEHGEGITDCAACHRAEPGAPTASESHGAHAEADVGCAGCHGDAHAPTDPLSRCDDCHAELGRHGPTADQPCTTCHAFGAEPELGALEGSTAARAGLSGPAIDASRVHGAMDCRGCHDPHRDAPPEVRCESCHRGRIAEELAGGAPGHLGAAAPVEAPRDAEGTATGAGCQGCHAPHADRDDPPLDCLGCHRYAPAERAFEVAPGGARAQAAPAALSHEGRCTTCHAPHAFEATTGGCPTCHEAPAAALARLPEGTHGDCAGCHATHEPAPDAAVCGTCHEDVHAARGAGPRAHRDCLACHDAHGGRPSPRGACASCHAEAHRAVGGAGAPHGRCTSCHAPHGDPASGSATACASCHAPATAAFTASAAPRAHRCAGCHRPHAFSTERALGACAGCHAPAAGAGASHRGRCTACHEGHGPPMGQATACARCHAEVRPTVEAHAGCEGCHRPHRPAAAAANACAGCHAAEARGARAWPPRSAHAGRCAACHTPHAEDRAGGCVPCHAEQANRSHTGGHRGGCVGCHAPHAPPPRAREGGWWARCGGCHEGPARAVRSASGTHGRCAACHETPGAPLPVCASCHRAAPRQLAHRSHATTACASCHASHGLPTIGRATCLECHEDRARHFPDAPGCQSCHPFSR